MKTIKAKLGNMRKEQEFVVYPFKEGDSKIKIQSDKSIAVFDRETGEGVLSTKGSYSHHLIQHGQPYTFTKEFVEMCKMAQPHSGDQIGPGVYVA